MTASGLSRRLVRVAPAGRGQGYRLTESRRLLIGASVVGPVAVIALLAPFLAPFDPTAQVLRDRLLPPGALGEGGLYLLGTDPLGRDVLSRIIYGARVSLGVSLASVALAVAVGVPAGLVAGYRRGVVSNMIMALVEILTTFPYILLALALVAVLGPDLKNLIVVLSIRAWPLFARIVEMQVRSLRGLEFVEAARSIGCDHVRILRNHLLPGVVGIIVVVATVEIARVILIEAALSFLGLGVSPEVSTWGSMLSDARDYIERAWWLSVLPGLAIFTATLGINLLGDGMREYLDPLTRPVVKAATVSGNRR